MARRRSYAIARWREQHWRSRAQLDLANLSQVDLRGASLVHVGLHGALFTGARMEMTRLGDCDLSGALDLTSVLHHGPSIVGLDTLMRSRGEIPEAFLQPAGVPKSFIEIQRQLNDSPLDYHRILLVGSIKDGDFVEQLQADLRESGVACWHLPVDDEEALLRDESFPVVQRLTYYDHIVLVCSHHSLESPYAWRLFAQVLQPGFLDGNQHRTVALASLDRSWLNQSGGLWDGLRQQTWVDFSAWPDGMAYRQELATLMAWFRTVSGPREVEEEPSPAGD